jgi:two-component system response regulator AtoC
MRVIWSGRPPDANLRRALREEGIALEGDEAADPPAAEVVASASSAVTRSRDGLPWIWLAGGAPTADELAAAVARGAYDAIAARDDGAGALLMRRLRELATPEPAIPEAARFVAESEAARAVLRQIAHAARTSMPVLLTGETGTGKEIAARLLHEWSSRRACRFVPINCAAIPNDLIEAELFGYAKGAFTGSVRAYDGQLAAAAGGTVFLDEVDDTPLPFQVKLLRVLEDRVVNRIGDDASHVVDFRILAATNRDLAPLCAAGAFGPDLYERLAIVSIRLPPLRERAGDLPALTRHMVARFYAEEPEARERHQVEAVTPAALRAMAAYPWPGNVRELRNVIFEALVGKRAGTELLLSDLPRRILRGEAPRPGAGSDDAVVSAAAVRRLVDEGRFDLGRARDDLERAALAAALARAGGGAAAAARLLGRVGRGAARDPGGTVRAMMRRLGIASDPSAAAPPAAGAISSGRDLPRLRRSRRSRRPRR